MVAHICVKAMPTAAGRLPMPSLCDHRHHRIPAQFEIGVPGPAQQGPSRCMPMFRSLHKAMLHARISGVGSILQLLS